MQDVEVNKGRESSEPSLLYKKNIPLEEIAIVEVQEVPQRKEIPKNKTVKPRITGIVTQGEVEDVPKTHVEIGITEIGKLDITDFEKTLLESRRRGAERMNSVRKVFRF